MVRGRDTVDFRNATFTPSADSLTVVVRDDGRAFDAQIGVFSLMATLVVLTVLLMLLTRELGYGDAGYGYVLAGLGGAGFGAAGRPDGRGLEDDLATFRPDLVVLDIMLPGFDGLEVCRRIQADAPVPVLMLNARDDETDMLVGLGVGADDYMTKPFSMRELVAATSVGIIDGEPRLSCLTLAERCQGKSVTTLEGLSPNGALHPLQQAWIEHDVPQCGYCQAGQIMTASALLKGNPKPSDSEIETAMNGNICRCGTYHRIREAVVLASNKMK